MALMKQADAAAFLGVSIQTVRRYQRAGRLQARYAPGRTRSVALYSSEELQRLKEERAAPRERDQQKGGTVPIAFRLDRHHAERLSEEARAQRMKSADYARALLTATLDEGLRSEVETLKAEARDLRADFSAAAAIILEYVSAQVSAVRSGEPHKLRPMTKDQIARWVEENLRR